MVFFVWVWRPEGESPKESERGAEGGSNRAYCPGDWKKNRRMPLGFGNWGKQNFFNKIKSFWVWEPHHKTTPSLTSENNRWVCESYITPMHTSLSGSSPPHLPPLSLSPMSIGNANHTCYYLLYLTLCAYVRLDIFNISIVCTHTYIWLYAIYSTYDMDGCACIYHTFYNVNMHACQCIYTCMWMTYKPRQ